MNKKIRRYDEIRKKETFEKLLKGIEELKEINPNKPVTKYALSKYTGIARQTISKYAEITALLSLEQEYKYHINTPDGKRIVKNQEDIQKIVDSLVHQSKQKDKQYEKLFKENTTLNLKIVQQKDEINKLNNIIERYKKVINDEN